MTVLAAPWLLLLIPWAALAFWLWRRDPVPREVTATFLWTPDTDRVARSDARRSRPPVWILCLLLASLLAILALAQPAWRTREPRVHLIVDPSVSLSARAGPDRTVLGTLISQVDAEMRDADVSAVTVEVAGASSTAGSLDALRATRFTTRSTDAALRSAIERATARGDPVVVLTDRSLPGVPDSVAVLRPTSPFTNVGIARVAVVDRPSPQAMVRIANFGSQTSATLQIRSGETIRELPVTLPPKGEERNVFVDLGSAEPVVAFSLAVADDLAIDNVAWLARASQPPRLATDSDVPAAVARFVRIFNDLRRPPADARLIRIGSDPRTQPSLLVPSATESLPASPAIEQGVHPVLADVSVEELDIARTAREAPAGFTPIARVGGRPVLAVRDEGGTRQVWIGFDVDASAHAVDWVVLMGNAIEWLNGDARPEWTGTTPDEIRPDWQPVTRADDAIEASPGLYRDEAGRTVAVNVPAVRPPDAQPARPLGDWLRRTGRATLRPLHRPALAAAAALVVAAAALTGGPRRLDARRGAT